MLNIYWVNGRRADIAVRFSAISGYFLLNHLFRLSLLSTLPSQLYGVDSSLGLRRVNFEYVNECSRKLR